MGNISSKLISKLKNNIYKFKKHLIKKRNDYNNRRERKIYKELFTDDHDIFDGSPEIGYI